MGWQDVLRTVAPTVAAGLGGPLAGIVATIVAGAIFPDDKEKQASATPESVKKHVEEMTSPDDVAKLKQAERDLKKFEADNQFRFAELDATSTQNARDMRIASLGAGNKTADYLSWAVLGSFLLVATIVLVGCGLVLSGGLKLDKGNDQIWIAVSGLIGAILGYFSANAQQVVGFYFGSSSASAAKSEQLAHQTSAAVNALVETAKTNRSAGADAGAGSMVVQTNRDGTATIGQGEPATSEILSLGLVGGRPVALTSPVVIEAKWDSCITSILKSEGGFVDDPSDHGGATNMGITQATLAAWRKHEGTDDSVTRDDVKNMTETEAKAIYRARYWNVLRCDALAPGVDLCVFDVGVLSGPARAASMLQKAVGLTGADVDSVIGEQTIAAANKMQAAKLVEQLSQARQAFYNGIVARDPTQQRFLKGWTNRVNAVKARAAEMVRTWS